MFVDNILDKLEELYPDAHCELDYFDLYSLTISVVLSAQTTDKRVNIVTKDLFKKYPNIYSLKDAILEDVIQIIKPLGLAKNKATSIIELAKRVCLEYNGNIPCTLEDLMSLKGLGRKCANVILSEWYHIPSIPVDTHVERVVKRLNLVPESFNTLETELKLKELIKEERLSRCHHLFIFFGRYTCKSKSPNCLGCPFTNICIYNKENKSE